MDAARTIQTMLDIVLNAGSPRDRPVRLRYLSSLSHAPRDTHISGAWLWVSARVATYDNGSGRRRLDGPQKDLSGSDHCPGETAHGNLLDAEDRVLPVQQDGQEDLVNETPLYVLSTRTPRASSCGGEPHLPVSPRLSLGRFGARDAGDDVPASCGWPTHHGACSTLTISRVSCLTPA